MQNHGDILMIKECKNCCHNSVPGASVDQDRCAGCFMPVMSNYSSKSCFNCVRSVTLGQGVEIDGIDEICWSCRRLGKWEAKGQNMRYDGDDWADRLVEGEARRSKPTFKYDPRAVSLDAPEEMIIGFDSHDIETGKKVIAKCVRPKYTVWKQTTVHKRIKASARRSRRVFKQYLKTGSLRLLKAAERKITSWDFD
jgi:hypothetical protein